MEQEPELVDDHGVNGYSPIREADDKNILTYRPQEEIENAYELDVVTNGS